MVCVKCVNCCYVELFWIVVVYEVWIVVVDDLEVVCEFVCEDEVFVVEVFVLEEGL